MRTKIALIAAAAALSFALPAHADEGVGFNAEIAGSVAGTSFDVTAGGSVSVGDEYVAGQCTFTGQTNSSSGGIDYEYAGEAVSTSTAVALPEVTDVMCTLSSPAQGLPGERPTLSASFEVVCPLAACATASATANWPARPVVICVDGFAVFGPTPVVTKQIIHACKTSTL